MIVLLFASCLVATVLGSGKPGCSNITIQSEGNCPRKGFDCDENLPIKYYPHHGNWAQAEIVCADRKALLAVDHQIVDRVRCRDKKWRAEGNCDIPTTSVVCARYCDVDACPSSLRHAPSKYERLDVHEATSRNKCAVAKCKYGFVILTRDGDLIKEFPSSTIVSCTGSGQWAVSATEKYAHVMCKRRPKSCGCKCNDKPWGYPTLYATSAAIRDGCKYFCPASQVLSRKNKEFAQAISSATCTHRGFLVTGDKVVNQIGCSTCDVPDGPVANPTGNKKAISKNCILSCPRGYSLRYGRTTIASEIKFAPRNVLYRNFRPSQNNWITRDGKVVDQSQWIDCVSRFA